MKLCRFKTLVAVFCGLTFSLQAEDFSSDPGNNRVLTFPEAVMRALSAAPQLKIAACDIEEALGQKVQSQTLPNPVASYSVENVFGHGDWKGWDSAESRYEIEQLFELGGKRNFRHRFASYQYYAARAAYEAKKNALLNRLYRALVEAAKAQELFLLAEEQKRTAEEVHQTVSAKVEAGKTACVHQNRTEISLASTEILLEKASLLFENAKTKLSLLWASNCPDFDRVEFALYDIEEPPALEHCLSQLEWHPELLKARLEIQAAQANIRFEKAGAIPDVVLGVGYKTLQDSKEKGLIFGASVPLPIFDQNRGNIKSAYSEKEKAKIAYTELAVHLQHKISLSQKEMMRAYWEAGIIRDTLLKSAQQSHEYVKEGYKEGKFEYLDLLECEKTLTELKEKYVQALLEYHLSKADIEYLYSQEQP